PRCRDVVAICAGRPAPIGVSARSPAAPDRSVEAAGGASGVTGTSATSLPAAGATTTIANLSPTARLRVRRGGARGRPGERQERGQRSLEAARAGRQIAPREGGRGAPAPPRAAGVDRLRHACCRALHARDNLRRTEAIKHG